MTFDEMVESVKNTDTCWRHFSTADLFKAYQEVYQDYRDLKEVLDDRAESIAQKYADATGEKLYTGLESVDYGNEINVNTSYTHCGGCGADYKSISFPAHYMEMTDELLQCELAAIKANKEAEAAKQKATEKQRQLNSKMSEFNKLKTELIKEGVLS